LVQEASDFSTGEKSGEGIGTGDAKEWEKKRLEQQPRRWEQLGTIKRGDKANGCRLPGKPHIPKSPLRAERWFVDWIAGKQMPQQKRNKRDQWWKKKATMTPNAVRGFVEGV